MFLYQSEYYFEIMYMQEKNKDNTTSLCIKHMNLIFIHTKKVIFNSWIVINKFRLLSDKTMPLC